MTADPERLLFTRDGDALGRTQRSFSRQVAARDLARVRRGAHLPQAEWEALGAIERFRYAIHALVGSIDRPIVVSHWAAAVLHGLPAPIVDGMAIDVTVGPGTNRAIKGVRAHACPLPDEDVELIDGVLCTSWARTVVDVASSSSFRDAVVLADAALHRIRRPLRADAQARLEEVWDRAQPRRSTTKVRTVLDFADGDSGSVAESHSRVSMRVAGIPVPILQHRFVDADGVIGDGDFWFPEFGVVGESDGRIKYTDPVMTKGDPERVLYDEKVREDRMRALPRVRGFARWDFAVSCSPRRLAARLIAAGVRVIERSRMRSGQM